MVWALVPVDPLPGEDTYYIFAKGTYKLGRKGCDIIINKDKGVSRVHAELVVDEMTSLNPLQLQKNPSRFVSKVRIRDCSKYGTFFKDSALKGKVNEMPNKEADLKDGDQISFGTGTATYRFCFIPIVLFVNCPEPVQGNHHFQDKVSLIGARMTHDLSPDCTHVLVDQSMQVKEDLVDAIVAKKPFVLNSWLELLAEKAICTEFPSCSSYAPTLTLEGVSVRIADPKSRENCLKGYKFLLESTHMYTFGDQLDSLLAVCGAIVLPIEGYCLTSQGSDDGQSNPVVCVIPGGSENKVDRFHKLRSLSRLKEMDLVHAVLSGHLDPSLLISSTSVLISSSCSTDETVVADSDEEVETATSSHANCVVTEEASKYDSKVEMISDHAGPSKVEIISDHADIRSDNSHIRSFQDKNADRIDKVDTSFQGKNAGSIDKVNTSFQGKNAGRIDKVDTSFQGKNAGSIDKVDGSETENIDVIYSQNLIVRNINLPATTSSTTNNGVIDFKRFRKVHTESGNSFLSLIPYSKYPYKDSDYENEEVVESVKEEKKRKQMEAAADDLFNNEKGKRRGVAGSLRGFLTLGRQT